jgi:hypothetical protein
MKALTGLPLLDLVIQEEVRSAAHHLSGVWGVGLTFTTIKNIVAYCHNFRSLSQYLIWESTL